MIKLVIISLSWLSYQVFIKKIEGTCERHQRWQLREQKLLLAMLNIIQYYHQRHDQLQPSKS